MLTRNSCSFINRENRVPYYQRLFQQGKHNGTRQWLQVRLSVARSSPPARSPADGGVCWAPACRFGIGFGIGIGIADSAADFQEQVHALPVLLLPVRRSCRLVPTSRRMPRLVLSSRSNSACRHDVHDDPHGLRPQDLVWQGLRRTMLKSMIDSSQPLGDHCTWISREFKHLPPCP